jgi:uncharacterized protein (DUF3820 family)
MAGEIVPFGKYKGRPVEDMAADRDYCDWMAQQPWFREKFANIYNVVINYGVEPTETPEHNAMQARFLDDAYCLALLQHVRPGKLLEIRRLIDRDITERMLPRNTRRWDSQTVETSFEFKGWDVITTVHLSEDVRYRLYTEHPAPYWSHQTREGTDWYETNFAQELNVGAYCSWDDLSRTFRGHATLLVECKPTMGDDYPAVLRQVHRNMNDEIGIPVVLVGSYTGRAVPWEAVKAIFAKSHITLVLAGFETPQPCPF